jgi:tyrosine-protein kinase Etk/Wzc
LLYSSPDKPLRTLLLTSSGPGEGKSLTVTNVALAFAQMGSRVLLVDTDLRRPVVHHLFQIRREPGFCELFLPSPDWGSIVRPTSIPNLSVIPAGRFTPSPAELLGSHKMDEILERLHQMSDIVLFDTPPLVAVTDATVLSKKADGVVLVIKSRKTEREFSRRAINILQGVGSKIIGVVLNDIDLSHRYSSYGYYKYYYHYYRSKKD